MDEIMTPRVSVIVPAYNAAGFIVRALNSALAQTMPDLEVIVVDDASKDTTLPLARAVAARDPRVRVLHNEHNLGMYPTYNRGIDAAKGEWIAALDADDVWLPERLERLLTFADTEDLVSDDQLMLRAPSSRGGRFKMVSLLWSHGLTVTKPRRLGKLEFVRHDLGLLKPLIRSSFLREHGLRYDPDLKIGADFLLYFEFLLAGARWLQLPAGYYLYWTHGENTSSDTLEISKDVARVTERLLRDPAVAKDPTLGGALERRARDWESNGAFAVVSDLARERHVIDLVRLLVNDPSYLYLASGKLAKSVRRRTSWRISSVSGQYSQAKYLAR
jgi:glycosyltransferase involved in cell wall biosynthesis